MRGRHIFGVLLIVMAAPGMAQAVAAIEAGPACAEASGTAECRIAVSGTGEARCEGDGYGIPVLNPCAAVSATGEAACRGHGCAAATAAGEASCQGRPCLGVGGGNLDRPGDDPPDPRNDNRVDEWDFRNWTDGSPDRWRVLEGQVSPVVDPVRGTVTFDPTRATLTFGDGHRTTLLQPTPQWRGEDQPIVPGQRYTFIFFADVEVPGDARWDPPRAIGAVIWKDANANGEWLEVDFLEVPVEGGYDWYVSNRESSHFKHYNDFRAPLGATDVEVRFVFLRASTDDFDDASFHVDDVHLFRDPAPPREVDRPCSFAERHVGPLGDSYLPGGSPIPHPPVVC